MKIKFPTYVVCIGENDKFGGIVRVDKARDQVDHWAANEGDYKLISGKMLSSWRQEHNEFWFYAFEAFDDKHKLVRMVIEE